MHLRAALIAAAILCSLLAVLSGLFLSFYLGLASGGTIVIIAIILFLLSLCLSSKNA